MPDNLVSKAVRRMANPTLVPAPTRAAKPRANPTLVPAPTRAAKPMTRVTSRFKVPTRNRVGKTMPNFGGVGGVLTGAAVAGTVGAVTGGVYASDGFSFSGAMKGAIGGAVLGAATGMGMPAGIGYAAAGPRRGKVGAWMGAYSGNLTSVAKTLNTAEGRNTMWAAGGLLGGSMFGGDTSKRRGFNKNRGTCINC